MTMIYVYSWYEARETYIFLVCFIICLRFFIQKSIKMKTEIDYNPTQITAVDLKVKIQVIHIYVRKIQIVQRIT